jgi:NAD(P)-dependent dehydrogenase (short-subunit alcohol dehydrogenase family)
LTEVLSVALRQAGLNGVANSPAYSSAKAGIIGLTKSFALAMTPYGATQCHHTERLDPPFGTAGRA